MSFLQITVKLTCQGIKGEDIGVITPYNSQANLIKHYLPKSVEIHTIDKYQVTNTLLYNNLFGIYLKESLMIYNCISHNLGKG